MKDNNSKHFQMENTLGKPNIGQLTREWAVAFSADTSSDLLSLYTDEAILWGTFSLKCLRSLADISDYFNNFFSLKNHKVVFNNDELSYVHGNVIVSAGTYVFSWEKDDKSIKILARYSFSYVKYKHSWKIVSHHSSILPEP